MKKLFFVSTVILWAHLACAMDTPELALIEAAAGNKVDRVLEVLHAGVDVNAAGSQGDTALMHAAYHGHIEVCSVLIKAGANVHQRDIFGQTALSAALNSRREAVISLLMKNGADINMSDQKGRSPLMNVARAITDLYLNTPKDGMPPHWPRLEKMQFLLECGANPNDQRVKSSKTALMYAIQAGDEALCALLLKHGACVGLQDRAGHTALFLATHYGNGRICEMLVNHQAALDRSMITYLCCLKRSQNPSARFLYGLSKNLLSRYLKQFSLQILLKARCVNGHTAYDHLQMEYIISDDKQQLAASDYLQLEYLKPGRKQRVVGKNEEHLEEKEVDKKNKKCSIQ